MAPDAQGTQSVSLAGLAAGRWTLHVKWSVGDRAFYAERAVVAR
jgi:hypothetical protein